MAGTSGPSAGYYQPPIAQAREIPNAVYQVCTQVESTLPKCLRAQETFIIGALLTDLVIARENSMLAL